MDCIFCKIISGEIPSYTVFEDDVVKVFLDVNPVSKGHCLVVPKKHFENILDIDSNVLNHCDDVIKELYPILKEKLNCSGITRIQNNEYGQEIKHYHMHLVPRYEDDGILKANVNKQINVEEIYKILN